MLISSGGPAIESTALAEVKRLRPVRHADARGALTETWNAATFAAVGLDAVFVQDTQVRTHRRGTLRGFHFQRPPHAQGKLVRVVRGRIFDVAADIRHGSPTFGETVRSVLDAEDGTQIWIPAGFAHAYLTLEDDTEVFYKVTGTRAPECEAGIRWDDPRLAVPWPVAEGEPILSERDRLWPDLDSLPIVFRHGRSV